MYKIGITEAGDAGIDLSWVKKLDSVDGAIVITKDINDAFIEAVLRNKDKLIVHATCTGYGGTVLEPNVPRPQEQISAAMQLVENGFPKKKVVIRVDPIIPTEKGLDRALSVIEEAMDAGFNRYRISVLDMYLHVRNRFREANLPLPYGDKFSASGEQMAGVDKMLVEAVTYWTKHGKHSSDIRIESCAEPNLKIPTAIGCISFYDLNLLGLSDPDYEVSGKQRSHCLCYAGKTELLRCKHPCAHECLYCYWRRKNE